MLAGPESRREMDRLHVARQLASPVNRAMAALLGHLTPPQWETLRAGHPLTVSTDAQPDELGLPEATARIFRSARPSMDDGRRDTDPELVAREQQRQREQQAQWVGASGYRVTIRLYSGGLLRDGGLAL